MGYKRSYKVRKTLKARGEGTGTSRMRGPVFRWRRGELVEVPPEWVGDTVSAQTRNKRKKRAQEKKRARRQQLNREARRDLSERLDAMEEL